MAVFTYRMPAGIPGGLTRAEHATVEPIVLDTTNYPTSYGVPMAIDATSKNGRKIIGGDAAAAVKGFYVRPFPTSGGASDGLGTVTPPTSGVGSILRRGYITVKNIVGTPAKGGQVYTRVTANGGNTTLGAIEATSDSTNTIAIANCFFTGAADSSGNVEIEVNL